MPLNRLCFVLPTEDDAAAGEIGIAINAKPSGTGDPSKQYPGCVVRRRASAAARRALCCFCGHRCFPADDDGDDRGRESIQFHDAAGVGNGDCKVGDCSPRIVSSAKLYVGTNGLREKEVLGSALCCFCGHRCFPADDDGDDRGRESIQFHDAAGVGNGDCKVGDCSPRIFSSAELYVGTNGFREKEVLGSGGFGRCFVLPTDDAAAAGEIGIAINAKPSGTGDPSKQYPGCVVRRRASAAARRALCCFCGHRCFPAEDDDGDDRGRESIQFHDAAGVGDGDCKVGDCSPRIFSYAELYVGTNGFSEKEVLGSGGFGRIYRAVLPSTIGC